MNRCLKILFLIEETGKDNFLQDFIQKNAKNLKIEGTAQVIEPRKVKIVACGQEEAVDKFIEIIYQGTAKSKAMFGNIEVEPFLRDRDYRGVFRIIE